MPGPIGMREQVKAIRTANPCAVLQKIGDKVGLSRERVRQILKSEGLQTIHYKQTYVCLNCQKEFLPACYSASKKWCSRNCKHEYTHPLVECDNCHELFRRVRGQLCQPTMKHTHYFCSKFCHGKYAGTHYGFVAHPENAGRDIHAR